MKISFLKEILDMVYAEKGNIEVSCKAACCPYPHPLEKDFEIENTEEGITLIFKAGI